MTKTKKKNKQRKLLLSLLLLVGCGILLGTSTFAWFTANKNVKVNPIDVNVEAKSGLQISADGITWKSILSVADITNAKTTYTNAVNQIPSTIEPVSTIGEIDTNGKMKMFLGEVSTDETTGNWNLSATQSIETNTVDSGSFVAYDLFLKTEAAATLYLTTDSGAKFLDTQDSGIKNATRVAFVTLGNTASTSSVETIQGLNGGTSSPVIIWEPNYDAHTANGVLNASSIYSVAGLTEGTGNEAVAYDGIKAPFDTSIETKVTIQTANKTQFSNYFDTVTPTIKTIDGFSSYQQLTSLSTGITKIRVYLWIEGQDVDCENNASGGNIQFNLKLSTSSSAAG